MANKLSKIFGDKNIKLVKVKGEKEMKVTAMLGIVDELFMESDYIEEYKKLGIEINENTRFSHVIKSPELIGLYQDYIDSKEVKRFPYTDPIAQKFLYKNVIIEYANILDDYVELVISVI